MDSSDAVAIQLENMYMMFSTAISGVFLPKVTSMVTNGAKDEEISDLFIRTGRIQYIVMAFILSAFIVLGKPFILLWAGKGYEDAYYICLMFFIPLTVPLIQNLGITFLQARNKMKFRSMLYIVIAFASLGISILLAKSYGIYGCAFATSFALFLGQIIIMNIYYHYKQKINIVEFWKEIIRMSYVPIILVIIGLLVINNSTFVTVSLVNFLIIAIVFTLIYGVSFWLFSMNNEEKELLAMPINKLKSFIKDKND